MKKRGAPLKNIVKNPVWKPTSEYKEQVRTQAYLGKKGYTIPKSALNTTDIEEVKKELSMTPFTMGPKTGPPVSFPMFRENAAKMYLPRFYGQERYGITDTVEITPGEDIDVPFVKELREYQLKIIDVYLKHVYNASKSEEGGFKGGGGILEVPCGKGKCLAKGTPVYLYSRNLCLVEDLVVGDVLLGDDGGPRCVMSIARGRENMVRICERGTTRSYTVNRSHILSLRHRKTGNIEDMSIDDYLRRNDRAEWLGWRISPKIIEHDLPETYEINLMSLNEDDYYGFEIDGNHRFVLGDMTVTHNTVMALNIISVLKKKTLILVHKEFLMNQWIERIQEFMPSARVGRIQGPVFDVLNKDIVIGMIQTMHSREFEPAVFDPFGLTVIDEVHRIGSEEFSKTLFRVVTPYMLGISATVERKDRLTKILYMFIGPKIYSEERTDDDVVQVRGIYFKTRDPTYNETEYDFRGAPKYSTMITKLCQYGPRSDFIVRILADLLTEHPEKQIMVLAHNRELLTYLYDSIRHKISEEENMVGYYVGGMKEKDLKITEGRRIVLATYAMAAEALDIKTLSTLVMATPTTDIEQSVGRILRAKGQNPIVVDLIDPHEYLRRQWNTRRQFYKKCRYRITTMDLDGYTGFDQLERWRVEYDPSAIIAAKTEPRKCMINIPKEILDAEEV
jgi:superfamily II DNA or RNA helicase